MKSMHDMVVVVMGMAKEGAEQIKPIEVFYDRILTTVRRQAENTQ